MADERAVETTTNGSRTPHDAKLIDNRIRPLTTRGRFHVASTTHAKRKGFLPQPVAREAHGDGEPQPRSVLLALEDQIEG